jgi:hypothetical protein
MEDKSKEVLTIKKWTEAEAESHLDKFGELPTDVKVFNSEGNEVVYKIEKKSKENKMENIEVIKEHIEVPKPVSFLTVLDALKTKRSVRVIQGKTNLINGFTSDDAGAFANGTAFVTDDVLPALVPAFEDKVIAGLNKVPVSYNSFRLLTFNAGSGYAYVNQVGTASANGPVFNNQGTLSIYSGASVATSTITSGLSVTLNSYVGNLVMSDELLEDVPAFQTQASDVLSKELSAQLQSAALTVIYASPSACAQPRTTSGTIVAADLWNMYSHAIKGDPNPRYAWIVSPSAGALIQQMRDYNTGLGAYIWTAETGQGLPSMRLLGLPIIEAWYAPAQASANSVCLVDLNTIVMGVKGNQGAGQFRVNPWLYFEYLATELQIKTRCGFGSRYQCQIIRNGFAQSNIVNLKATTT